MFGFGAGSGSVISRNGSEDPDPDPNQNGTDPKHWFIGLATAAELRGLAAEDIAMDSDYAMLKTMDISLIPAFLKSAFKDRPFVLCLHNSVAFF